MSRMMTAQERGVARALEQWIVDGDDVELESGEILRFSGRAGDLRAKVILAKAPNDLDVEVGEIFEVEINVRRISTVEKP